MIRKLLLPLLSIVVILAIVHTIPSSAADTTIQQVTSANMDGFAFTPSGCCILASADVHGAIMVGPNGARDLSQQSGIVTLDSTSYNLQFTPTGDLDVQTPRDDCATGSIYTQNGEITLSDNDGTTLKGSAIYSWGDTVDCSGSKYSFTNLSGKIQDSTGQMSEFFTGTDSSPEIR